MAEKGNFAARTAAWLAAFHLRRALRRARPAPFLRPPEPWMIGRAAQGRQLCEGHVQLAGHVVETGGRSLWALAAPDDGFEAARQGFAWLDDLAAQASPQARALARDWLRDWILRHGEGTGPGWTAERVATRMLHWLNHADFVMREMAEPDQLAFRRSLVAQLRYLSVRLRAVRGDEPRLAALTALACGGLTIEGLEDLVPGALVGLEDEARRRILPDGTVATRNPEDLMDCVHLLHWVGATLAATGQDMPRGLADAIARAVPVLRALRHADGALARFHGGGRAIEGRLDRLLAEHRNARLPGETLAMGYARLATGRTTLVMDAAPPPYGAASVQAHASTLAIELTSGRRPVIVSCGPGRSFGADWGRAGRATPSQSALCLDGYSSARLDLDVPGYEPLSDGPTRVPVEWTRNLGKLGVQGAHDGYVESHGLTHVRSVTLALDGRGIEGEDLLLAVEPEDQRRVDRVRAALGGVDIAFDVRFHLHPDVEAVAGADRVTLTLKSGETWALTHGGGGTLAVEDSVYLEHGRLAPRATKQVVLSGRAMEYATRVRWMLAKTETTGDATRDLLSDVADPYN